MIKAFAIWLYKNADTITVYVKNTLDVICLFVSLAVCYGLLLIGGAM